MEQAVQLKLDPWASDVDAAVAFAADDLASPCPVDVTVESARWEAIDPGDSARTPGSLVFIDGVRRVDARVLAAMPAGSFAFGLLGSFAVGAVRAGDGAPDVFHLSTGRLLILGRGCEHPDMTVTLSGGGGILHYAPRSTPGAEPEAPLLELQASMRRAEAGLACELAGGAATGATRPRTATAAGASPCALIVADGPLAYLERTPTPLVGLVKSLRRTYLRQPEGELLPRLRPGQRTPIFAILDKNQRFSWYLRLTTAGPGEHELAGIARLECSSQAGLPAARAMADRAAATLGRFASTRARDSRSPQNLVPIGGLEAALRHRLGDRTLVNRAICARLAGAQLAGAAAAGAPVHGAPDPIPAGET